MEDNEQTEPAGPEEHAQFQPRKGGLVESARAKIQAEQEQLAGHNAVQEVQAVRQVKPVATRENEPDAITAKTPIVQTGGAFAVIQLLGYDKNRKRAVIVTLDEPVVLANSLAQASDSRNGTNAAGLPTSGFVLPVNLEHVVFGAAAVYCAATSGTATRVSVWAETFTEGE